MMPLLNQKPWAPTSTKPPDGVSDTDKVFHLRQTGEIFADYESYLARVRLLQSKQWSAGGRDGLNFEQALVEEERAQELASQFPKELEEAALRVVHHSVLPLAKLAEEVHCHISSISGSSDKENLPGRKPAKAAPNKPIASHDVIRCWVTEVAEAEPHKTWRVWVAKQEYREKFGLPAQLPMEAVEALEKTAEKEGLGSKRTAGKSTPKTGAAKRKAGEAASPDGATGLGNKSKKSKASPTGANTEKAKPEAEPWVPPPVVPIEEEEKQLKANTHKYAAFHVLKAAGAEGMSVAAVMEAASQQGLRQYEGSEGQRRFVASTLATDPCFVRVKKGVYALRALMGDAPYEAVGRPAKKAAKDASNQAAKAAAPSRKAPTTPQAKAQEPAPSVPVWRPTPPKPAEPAAEEPYVPPPVRPIQEEEQRLKPGTNKAAIFAVLKKVGPAGLSVAGIMEAAAQQGLKQFADNQKGAVSAALTTDPAFVRVTKGVYAIRALMGDVPYEAVGKPSKKGPPKATGASFFPTAAAQLGVEQEATSLTKNEQIELEVRKSLEERRKALQKAMSQEKKAQVRLEKAAQEPRTPSKRVHEDALGPPPNFELSHDEKRFSGDPANKADIAAYKQRLAALQASNEAARREWQTRLAEAREKDGGGTSELAKAQRALKSAQKRVSAASAELAAVEQTFREAAKAASKEKVKKAAEERRAEEKRQREAAKAAERERKRAEALEAKRYPMEDLQLLAELKQKAAATGLEGPLEDLPLPVEWLPREEGDAAADLLFVADFAAQFAKLLKVKPPGYTDLAGLLNNSAEAGTAELPNSLWELYEGLLRLVLQEDGRFKRWTELLSMGTLTEVLRRFLDARNAQTGEADSLGLAAVSGELASKPLDALSGHYQRQLLCFLCDELLAGETMRQVIQDRLDESGDVKREMREAVAEKKGELKEILEAEKEEQRKKREEERLAKLAAFQAKQEAAQKAKEAAAGPAAQQGGLSVADQQQATAPGAAGEGGIDAVVEEEEEAEPSWELPPELQEFQGNSSDRKLLLAFRQKQQAARKTLERERAKWTKAAQQRAKEREARQKAKAEADKAKARAKAAAEEEVLRQQEAYDRELEKLLVRRAPLGLDRHYRRYWYGVAGQRSLLYVEDASGNWGALRTPEQLDALLAALDKRGLRESALHAALEKVQGALAQAMRRAQAEAAKREAHRDSAGGADQTRFPKRERTQAVIFNVTTLAAQQQDSAPGNTDEEELQGLEGEALSQIAGLLTDLQKEMADCGIGPPEEGWKSWSQTFQQASRNARAALAEEGSLTNFIAALKTVVVEAEDMLHDSAKAVPTDGSSSEGEAEREERPEGGKAKAARLWRDANERASWRDGLMEAETLAAVAFSTAQLSRRGMPLLERIERPKPARKARKEAKAAVKSASGKAGRAADPTAEKPPGPRPPTRANPGQLGSKDRGKAVVEKEEVEAKAAAKHTKVKAAEKRKAQPPQAQRVTRARAK